MGVLKKYNSQTAQWEAFATGSPGYTGSAGNAGYTGSAGTIGFTGSIGTGYTGSAGTGGSIGYTGSAGSGASTPAGVSDQPNTSTGYFAIPTGTTAQRPVTVSNGAMRINSTTLVLEAYFNGNWATIYSFGVGLTSSSPGTSAAQIKEVTGTNTNGMYWINLGNGQGTQQIYCIMDSAVNGGGWMVLYATPAGATSQTYRVSADRENASVLSNPFTENYSLNYAKRSGVRAICSQSQSLIYSGPSNWMRLGGYVWDSSTHSAGNFSFENSFSAVTSNGTADNSVRVGMINYNNSGGGDFGIGVDNLDHHNTSYYNLNSSCTPQYLYQYGAGYKVNTSLSGWQNATNACSNANTNDISFLIAMR